MSREKGEVITCDRCKKQIFRKTIGDGETDGWSSPYKLGDLCPDCSEKYEKLQSDFMNVEA